MFRVWPHRIVEITLGCQPGNGSSILPGVAAEGWEFESPLVHTWVSSSMEEHRVYRISIMVVREIPNLSAWVRFLHPVLGFGHCPNRKQWSMQDSSSGKGSSLTRRQSGVRVPHPVRSNWSRLEGSSQSWVTVGRLVTHAPLAQLVEASRLERECWGFESLGEHAGVVANQQS